MLAGLLDAYGARGGPLSELSELERSDRIVFAGLGSSRYAALDAAVLLAGSGRAGLGGIRLGRRRHAAVPGRGLRGDLGVGPDT